MMTNAKINKLGTTFSQVQCRYLGLDFRDTFREISELGFDYIRLCAYWNEIEPASGKYDFADLDWLIGECQRQSIEIVLAVGMKVPRWPEFHFPVWIEQTHDTTMTNHPLDKEDGLAEYALRFVEKVSEHLQDVSIMYWQVENEALSTPGVANGRYLSPEFVQREIELVKRNRSKQKILLTNSVEMLPWSRGDRQALEASIPLGDAIGFNVYTKVPGSSFYYHTPSPFYWKKLSSWQRKVVESNKDPWIAEAQAEPWERNMLVATERLEYPSASPEATVDLVAKLKKMGFRTILLWGCEYWVWHKRQGSLKWFDAITNLIKTND